MEILTQAQLEKKKVKELRKMVRELNIPGRSKLRGKITLIHAILLDQTQRLWKAEEMKLKSLHPDIHKSFVMEIQGFLKENPDIDDEILVGMIEKHVSNYSRVLIMKAIGQARKFLAVQAESRRRLTEVTFSQDFDDLLECLAAENQCSINFAKAALSGVLSEVAEKLAKKYVVRQDADKDTYFLTKEIADRFLGGFIGKTQFWSLHDSIARRQKYLRARGTAALEAARQRRLAEEKAAAKAREEKRARAAAEAKAREEARTRAKKKHLGEIKNRPATYIRFRGSLTVIPVLPVNDLTEAQMLAADFRKPVFVMSHGEIKRVSNSKSGRLQMEHVYNFDVVSREEVQAIRRGAVKETPAGAKANVVSMNAPKVYPTWVSGEKGSVRAVCIVNPDINMNTLDYVNAVSRFLRGYDWVVLEYGKKFFLFERAEKGFVACGTAKKATREEKKRAKAVLKAAAKAIKAEK